MLHMTHHDPNIVPAMLMFDTAGAGPKVMWLGRCCIATVSKWILANAITKACVAGCGVPVEDVVHTVDQMNHHLLTHLPEYPCPSEEELIAAAAGDARFKAGKGGKRGAKRGAKRKTIEAAAPAEVLVRFDCLTVSGGVYAS